MASKSLPTGKQGKPVHLLLDEGALLIINPPAAVEKDLHIQVKSMEPVIRWRSVHTLMTTLRNYVDDREFPRDLLEKAHELLEEYRKDSDGVSKVRVINLFKRLPDVWSEGLAFRTGEQKSVRKTEPLFTVIRDNPIRVIQTMQGFTREIVQQLDTLKIPYRLVDKRQPFPKPDLRKIGSTRFSQKRLVINGLQADQSGLVGAPTRYGKCIGPETPVMMFDGSIKEARHILPGDLLMGPDSSPRCVEYTYTGNDEMFEVIPTSGGMSWTCNKEHLLHVERTSESKGCSKGGTRENIAVKDWINKPKWFRHVRKQIRTGVEFPESLQDVPPYIYGLWLGDGHEGELSLTTMDKEMEHAWVEWGEREGLVVSTHRPVRGRARTTRLICNHGVGGSVPYANKNRMWIRERKKEEGIRKEYIIASRDQRLQLLAGLIDSDGCTNNNKCYDITTKYPKLAQDIEYIAHTLGFKSSIQECQKSATNTEEQVKRTYYRVKMSGPVDCIPVRVPRKKLSRSNRRSGCRVGFEVNPVGVGPYVGFKVDHPDGLFLLRDGTIVHNSYILCNWIRCYPTLSILVVIPGSDLLKQTTALIKELNPGREVKMIGGGSTVKYQAKAGGVTVCSVDSLHKITSPPDLILADEPHSLVSDTRITKWDPLLSVRRLAVGATLSGRFDGRDRLITGLFGPVLDEVTYREAVAEGAICPLVVFFLEIEINTSKPLRSRNKAYNELLFENRTMANTVCRIMKECVPSDWQSMTFVSHEKQADLYLKAMGGDEATIAMAKKLPGKQRDAVFARMQSGEIKRCFATNIYAQGVTFSDLRLMINAEGGGNNTSAIQKPGRLAEIREGKPYGLVVDFLFTPDNPEAESRVNQGDAEWYNLVRDSRARRKAYEDKGYEVLVVRDMPELKSQMRKYMTCP